MNEKRVSSRVARCADSELILNLKLLVVHSAGGRGQGGAGGGNRAGGVPWNLRLRLQEAGADHGQDR